MDYGRGQRAVEGKTWPPVTPVIDITSTEIRGGEQEFLSAAANLRPLYDICLRVKTDAELERELRRRRRQRITVSSCPVCGQVFNPPTGKFCPKDGTFVLDVEPGIDADSPDQVHCRDDGSFETRPLS